MPTMGELGQTGLIEYKGIIQDDFLRELRGKEGYKRYREMTLNSPIVGALLMAVEQSIRNVTWTFTSDAGGEDERLELIELARTSMTHSFDDHIVEALSCLPYGFALFEIVYQRVEGKIVWKRLAPRGQDTVHRWLLGDNGEIKGFEQHAPPTYQIVSIPIQKLILYRARHERNNPEGRSILRSSWIPYYYAKNIMQIEAIGIERDLAGLPVVTLPEGADTSDTDSSDAGKARKMVRNIRNDEQAGIVLPAGWTLELLSTGGSRQFDTSAVVNRYETRILMSALAQFLMLGQQNVGSLALSKDQTDFFTMSVNALADIICATFMNQAIPSLMELNGYDAKGLRFDHSPAGDMDVNQLAEFLGKTSNHITWTPEDEVWLRSVSHLPEMSAEDIAAERDRKRQQAMAEQVAAMITPPGREGKQPNRQGDEKDDKQTGNQQEGMGAEVYASAPSAAHEARLQASVRQYLDSAFQRVLKMAKRAK